MQITTLIITILVLVIILLILIFFFLQSRKTKELERQKKVKVKKARIVPLATLRDNLRNKNLDTKELQNILDIVLKDHGVIFNFDIYMDIIIRMTHHPHVNKDIILSFEKELATRNPKYKSAISRYVYDGLTSRRVKA